MTSAEVAIAPTDLSENETTDGIKLEETPESFPAEEPDIEEVEENLSQDKYEENPILFDEDTEEGTTETLPEEEEPIRMVDEEEEEDEITSDENEE